MKQPGTAAAAGCRRDPRFIWLSQGGAKLALLDQCSAHEAAAAKRVSPSYPGRVPGFFSQLAEERERQSIARDLHDDPGQSLHLSKLSQDLARSPN